MRAVKAKRMRKFYGEHRDERDYSSFQPVVCANPRRAYQDAKRTLKMHKLINAKA